MNDFPTRRAEAVMWMLPFSDDNQALLPAVMRAYRDGVLMTETEWLEKLKESAVWWEVRELLDPELCANISLPDADP